MTSGSTAGAAVAVASFLRISHSSSASGDHASFASGLDSNLNQTICVPQPVRWGQAPRPWGDRPVAGIISPRNEHYIFLRAELLFFRSVLLNWLLP
jgi:hypothetical protein